MMEQRLDVKREGEFSYPILFEKDFGQLSAAIEEVGLAGRRLCVVTDSHVAPLYLPEILRQLSKSCSCAEPFVFPAGEPNKNLDTVSALYAHLISQGIDRKSFLVALGGGVTGDLTGFAAATYLRGIPFVQVPTTLLAQVDSSVGGKTGVDFQQYKNMVGAFHQPELVYMNLSVLKTLPEEEFACGMGEIIKTGLICDKDFFRWVSRENQAIWKQDYDHLSHMVLRCCQIKAGVVERDPREQGERALLNLGHTVGHAIEKRMEFSMLHGQCVAVGLAAAAALSRQRGLLSSQEEEEIKTCCKIHKLPVSVHGLDIEEVYLATKKDKKMEQGHIRFILMDGIGKSYVDHKVTDEELRQCIREVIHE